MTKEKKEGMLKENKSNGKIFVQKSKQRTYFSNYIQFKDKHKRLC